MRGANATRSPALREAALAGTLQRPACPACGRRHATDAPFVYADPDHNDWISVATPADLPRWRDVEREAVAAVRTSLATSVADAFAAARVRVVFDADELRERLAIWDAGLDDSVVECVKLRCLREQPSIRDSGERIRVASIADRLVMQVIDGAVPERVRAEFRVARTVVDEVAADPEWRARFPALFEPGFVSIDRYLR